MVVLWPPKLHVEPLMRWDEDHDGKKKNRPCPNGIDKDHKYINKLRYEIWIHKTIIYLPTAKQSHHTWWPKVTTNHRCTLSTSWLWSTCILWRVIRFGSDIHASGHTLSLSWRKEHHHLPRFQTSPMHPHPWPRNPSMHYQFVRKKLGTQIFRHNFLIYYIINSEFI